jgi:hypothetical protein
MATFLVILILKNVDEITSTFLSTQSATIDILLHLIARKQVAPFILCSPRNGLARY